MSYNNMTFTTPLARRRIDRIQELLRGQAMNIYEIADTLYMSIKNTRGYVQYLHDNQMIYIECWGYRTTGMGYQRQHALYAWGNEKDAPEPPLLTPAQKAKRYRAQLRGNRWEHEKRLEVRRLVERKARPDWAAAWVPKRTAA